MRSLARVVRTSLHIAALAFALFSAVLSAQSQLTIATLSLPPATSGQPYSTTLTANGGSAPYTWSATTPLPSGLALSSSGVVSGIPAVAGGFNFSVQVTDSTQTSATAQIHLTIQVAALAIATVPPLFTGTVGVSYAQLFSATGGQKPYTWTLTGSTDGLTLDSATGNLAGTPQNAGTFNFTIKVTDSLGASATGPFSLIVIAPTLTISVRAPLLTGTVNVAYSNSLQVQANGGTPPYTWSLLGTPVPGLSLDPTSLLLSGTPTTAGTFDLTVQAKDASGLTATKVLSINIVPALTITTSRQLPNAVLNTPYSVQLAATGGQPPYRWSAVGLPAGIALNSATGEISGTPTAAGTFPITITLNDGASTPASADRFSMTVGLPALPQVVLSGLPAAALPTQQYTTQVSLGSSYPAPITGQAILTFSPATGPTDRTVQFSSGGTTANFNIPAGSTTADVPLAIQTGSVSGTITISLRLQVGGVDVTPSPAPSTSAQVASAAPVIRSVQVNQSGNTLNVVVTGYSTAREVTQAAFVFSAASGQSLQTAAASITVDVNTLFSTWFLDPSNSQFGSVFIFTQPFSVQGDVTAVIPVSVTLTNRVGSTTATIPH